MEKTEQKEVRMRMEKLFARRRRSSEIRIAEYPINSCWQMMKHYWFL
jgi:hypothetical protein